jgi:cyanophycin synthetase
MQLSDFKVLAGPNIWANYPVVEAWVDIGEFQDRPSNTLPGFNSRLMTMVPSMIEHRCSEGRRGGFFERLRHGTYMGHILEHVALELHTLAGVEIGFGRTRETIQPGLYRVVIDYEHEELARQAILSGIEVCLAAVEDRPLDVAAEVARLHALSQRCCLGPSTKAIVAAASERNIPVRRLNQASLVLLGHGQHARRVWTAETDRTSAIAESIAADKELTKSLLAEAGIPVPAGRRVISADDAWAATEKLGSAVVIKPLDANHGRAVFTGLTERAEVQLAFEHAQEQGSAVMVEQFVSGAEHRLLVVGDRVVAAARGDYAYVVGDGTSSILDLIELQLNTDPRRGDDENCPLNRIVLDAANRVTVEQQGYTPDAVPLKHTKVLIQRSDNLATDVTDEVHPAVATLAVQAARVIGLDIAGIDILARDISQPLEDQAGVVVEINSGPGLLMHLKPARGQPRPVGKAIVETLFDATATGRVPIVAVAGSHGTLLATSLIEHLWCRSANWPASNASNRPGAAQLPGLGVAAGYGVFVTGQRLDRTLPPGCQPISHKAQQNVLMNPNTAAALFELSNQLAFTEGAGFDRCQVAVITNIDPAEDLSAWFYNDEYKLVLAKRLASDVVLPTGYTVLNAADPLMTTAAEKTKGNVIYFARSEDTPALAAHRQRGGRVVFLSGSSVQLCEGNAPCGTVSLAGYNWLPEESDATDWDAVLAALGAAWALEVSSSDMAASIASYRPPAVAKTPATPAGQARTGLSISTS